MHLAFSRMISFRPTRLAAVMATVLIGASALLDPAARAQLPQPRLTSLSRTGLRAGETAEVSLRGSDLEGVTQLWFDHPGISAAHVKDLTFRVVSAPDVPLGHHDVRAVGTYGVSNPRAFIVGDRPESIEIEPNNTPEKANPIVVNTVMNGELNGGADVDCFALEGRKDSGLFLDLQAERIDSRLDATIRVLTPGGTELAESRDVFGARPVSRRHAAGRRPVRDQGARRHLRRLARPCLSLDGPRRSPPRRDPARGGRTRGAGDVHADRPRARSDAPRLTRSSRPTATRSSD